MFSRSVPNEVPCPVPVELLANLMRSDQEQVAAQVTALPMAQRAALAGFCFSRSHLRSLSFRIAAQCDVSALRVAAGAAGETLIEQSRNPTAFDPGPKVFSKMSIRLARSAG